MVSRALGDPLAALRAALGSMARNLRNALQRVVASTVSGAAAARNTRPRSAGGSSEYVAMAS